MIKVTVVRRFDTCTVTVAGHAGYAEKGKDIVCSAVSALYQTLVESVAQMTSNPKNVKEYDDKQIFYISKITAITRILVNSFVIGIEGVANAYPDYVLFEEKD